MWVQLQKHNRRMKHCASSVPPSELPRLISSKDEKILSNYCRTHICVYTIDIHVCVYIYTYMYVYPSLCRSLIVSLTPGGLSQIIYIRQENKIELEKMLLLTIFFHSRFVCPSICAINSPPANELFCLIVFLYRLTMVWCGVKTQLRADKGLGKSGEFRRLYWRLDPLDKPISLGKHLKDRTALRHSYICPLMANIKHDFNQCHLPPKNK